MSKVSKKGFLIKQLTIFNNFYIHNYFEINFSKNVHFRPGSKVVRSLPENFSADMIPEAARETCQNWFYKIASIRELVPRLYVELAIIRSYNFLKNR